MVAFVIIQLPPGDYLWTFFGFIGLATPAFLLAMILMLFFSSTLGMDVGGLFSVEYELSAWSIAKAWGLIKHLPIPIIVLGTAGTAGLIRILRDSLLDELARNYVATAHSPTVGVGICSGNGRSESVAIVRHPTHGSLGTGSRFVTAD